MCVWIYDNGFTIKNSLRSAEHDVCVWIYDKTIIINEEVKKTQRQKFLTKNKDMRKVH